MTSETPAGQVSQMRESLLALSAGRVRLLGWCLACAARGWGATEGGSGVLHEGPGFVQYAPPLASSAPPSCSAGWPGVGVGRNLEPALNHALRAPAQEPEVAPAGEGVAVPGPGVPSTRHQDPAESIGPAAQCPQR